MPLTVTLFFTVCAAIAAIVNAVNGKCPLWVSVILICVVLLLQVLPK